VIHAIRAGDSSNYFRILSKSPKAQALQSSLARGFAKLVGVDDAVTVEIITDPNLATQAIWEKLAVNAVLNPICTLYNVPNGSLREDRFKQIRRQIAEEVDMVAAAVGVAIPNGAEASALSAATSTAENFCSMLADVQRNLNTEIDFINGHIVREAERLGLHAPFNRSMQAMIHALCSEADKKTVEKKTIPVLSTVHEMRQLRRQFHGRVGFVPTMGGLHEGHLSLIHACRARGCEHVIVSIFVNGSQFAVHEDFDRYPRAHNEDLKTLHDKAWVDAVFAPLASEIYPHDPRGLKLRTRIEPLDNLHEYEAQVRPHCFGGVAPICASLFNIVQPDVVAFGQKDALQCAVIQNLVEDLQMPIDVVVADTVRTTSGLAKSTRNKYLDQELLDASPLIATALKEGADKLLHQASHKECKSLVRSMLSSSSLVSEIEYVSIADRRSGKELEEGALRSPDGEAVISCAVKMKSKEVEVRLIDNICIQY
jgi:pantoate--beta-alanine ligase